MREGSGTIESPLPLLGNPVEREIFVRLQRVAEEIPRFEGKRRAVPAGQPTQRLIEGALQDDIYSGILGRHDI